MGKSCLRKSPVAADVDLRAIAVYTDKYTGADLTEICQRAAKLAIRENISRDMERARLAAEAGEGADEMADIEEEDSVPEITAQHFQTAVNESRRSVTDAQLAKYASFATLLGTARSNVAAFEAPTGNTPSFATTPAAGGEAEEDEEDLYS